MKTFKFAGTSVKNGQTKFRTANDSNRIKALEKDGQTDVVLVELPQEMDKVSAARYCLAHEKFTDIRHQVAISELFVEERSAKINTVKPSQDPVIEPEVESNAIVATIIEDEIPELEAEDDYADILEMAGFESTE